MVPKGWSLVDANEICESISVGVVIKPTQYYVDENEGVKAFRSANVREGFINDSDWVYFSQEGHLANKKSQLKSGDVLIVRTGYPGTACVVTPEFEGANAIDIVIARPQKNKVLPEYLCAYTNSSIGKSQVLNLQGGMAQKHLNVGAYQTLKVKLPPLLEQKKIAKVLSTWDKAIATTEKLLINSQQQKKSLMQKLLTGSKRLAGFNDKWKDGTLGDLAIIDSGFSFKSTTFTDSATGIPIVRMNNLKNGKLELSDAVKIISSEATELDKFLLAENDFVFGMSGSLTNYAWVTAKDLPCYLNQRVGRLSARSYCDQVFVSYLYLSDIVQQSILDKAEGAAQLNISLGALRTIPVKYPSLEEQIKIASVLTAADDYCTILKQKIHNLKQEKKALMQQLLTGKRRVKTEGA